MSNRSNDWVFRMIYAANHWRREAAGHRLGTIVIFGQSLQSINFPIRTERQADNDNRLLSR